MAEGQRPVMQTGSWGTANRVGSVLKDKWSIDSKIAQGGVATVYEATHKNGTRVAIKMLHPEFSRNLDVRNRFLREGYAANSVNHPNIVQILYDDVTEDGSAFIVMELLKGEVLEAMRTRMGGKVPLKTALPLVFQLLDVLDATHQRGIVHRDIKPDNLFVCEDGQLKVLDFGVAQIREGFVGRGEEQTQSGMLLGTPEFMPPEQVLGQRENVDQQSDIWAVGATMFILLSGENVHPCETVSQFLIAAASQPARTLGSAAPWVPPPICAVVDRALAFDKQNRWPTARMMIEALEQAAKAALGNDAPRAPKATERSSQHRMVAAFTPDSPPRSVGSAFASLVDDERTAIGRFEARSDAPVSVRPDVSFAPADPFEVTTLAPGEMLPLDAIENAHLAIAALDGPPSDDERTLSVGPPRGEPSAQRKDTLTIPSVPAPPRPSQGRGRSGPEDTQPPPNPNGQQAGGRASSGPLFGGSHFSGPSFGGPRSQRPQVSQGPAFGSFGPGPLAEQRQPVRSAPATGRQKQNDPKQLYLMLGIGGLAFVVLAVIAAVAMTR